MSQNSDTRKSSWQNLNSDSDTDAMEANNYNFRNQRTIFRLEEHILFKGINKKLRFYS